MKWPTDPKKRQQAVLAAAGGGLLVLLLVIFGLSRLLAARNEVLAELADIQQEHERIRAEIQALPVLRQSRDDLFDELNRIGDNHILFHEYRNYHLTSRERLIPLAAEFGIQLDIPKESVPLDLPIPSPKTVTPANAPERAGPPIPRKKAPPPTSTVFALYPVIMTGTGSFDRISAFLEHIETVNPYLAVSELTITARPDNPEAHAFTLSLLWPIWKNLEQKPKLQDLIMPMRVAATPSTEEPEAEEEREPL